MSDTTISLEWIGAQLRAIQAEQRTIRAENEILRTTIMNMLGEVVRVLSDRISNFEALAEARIDHLGTKVDHLETKVDQLGVRVDQFETSMDARFDRVEALLRPPAAP